jgi:hypothetical protein
MNIRYQHPVWVKLLGWLFLPIMLFASLYILALPIIQSNYELVLIGSVLFLGGGCLYMTVNGLMVLPHISSVIIISPDGLEIDNPKKGKVLRAWGSIFKAKHIASAQVLHLYTEDGRFLSVTEQFTGYSALVESLK